MGSDHGFWETLDLLIGTEWRKPLKEDVVHDWVEKVVAKRQMTKAISEENNVTLKEFEKSSGYGSESKKSLKVEVEKMSQFVQPTVQCTYVFQKYFHSTILALVEYFIKRKARNMSLVLKSFPKICSLKPEE